MNTAAKRKQELEKRKHELIEDVMWGRATIKDADYKYKRLLEEDEDNEISGVYRLTDIFKKNRA